jgi:hypothetical protein
MVAKMPAATKECGQSTAGPDSCVVPQPPAPEVGVPFPNKGMVSQGKHGNAAVQKALFKKKKMSGKRSQIPGSRGDEAGSTTGPTPKGMMSQKHRDKIKYKSHSSKVKAEGKGIVPIKSSASVNVGDASGATNLDEIPEEDEELLAIGMYEDEMEMSEA